MANTDQDNWAPFDSEEDHENFQSWLRTKSELKSELQAFDKFGLIYLLMISAYQDEKAKKQWWEALEIISELHGVIDNDPNLKARHKRVHELIKSEAYDEVRENLSIGSPLGVKARQEIAKKKQTNLIEAIKGLFDKPDKPGWGWTNQQIANFLKEKGDWDYKESSVLQTVKREAAMHRKSRKAELASKFLNR